MSYPFPALGIRWSARDLCAGFAAFGADPADYQLAETVATMLAESNGEPLATGTPLYIEVQGRRVPTVDLGLCQLTSYYHTTPGVEAFPGMSALSVVECYTPLINIERAWDVIARLTGESQDWDLSPWVAWKKGRHKDRFDEAYAGLVEYREWLEAQ